MTNVWDEAMDAPPETVDQLPPLTGDTLGLMWIGHLTATVTIGQHKIGLRTLKIGEELEAELAVQKFKETEEAGSAYATALISAAITSVDDQPLIVSLGPAEETVEAKFKFVSENWHRPVIEMIYAEFRELNERAKLAAAELSKD